MESELQVGKVVWVYKIGCEGEIVNQVWQELQMRYHIRIPAEDETYIYNQDDLFVFGPEAEANIRKEWSQQAF